MKHLYKVIPCLLLMFFISLNAYSQVDRVTTEQLQDMSSKRIMTKTATDTQGSPYFLDKFIKGVLTLNNGKQTGDTYIRFDIHNNTIEFLRNKDIYKTDASKVKAFKILGKNENIVFKNNFNTNVDDITADTFLNILYNGNNKLVVHYKSYLREDLANSYASATKKNKYETYRHYFIITPNGRFHKLDALQKNLSQIFPDRKKEIKNYIQKNNIDIKKQGGLIKVMQFIDSETSVS